MNELRDLLRSVVRNAGSAYAWLGPNIRDRDHGIGEALKLCTETRLILERVEMGLCKESAVAEEMLQNPEAV